VEVTLKRMWPGDLSDNYPTRGRMQRGFWLTAFTRGQNARETRGLNLAGIVAESARQTRCPSPKVRAAA
jgi:hypothetical protein